MSPLRGKKQTAVAVLEMSASERTLLVQSFPITHCSTTAACSSSRRNLYKYVQGVCGISRHANLRHTLPGYVWSAAISIIKALLRNVRGKPSPGAPENTPRGPQKPRPSPPPETTRPGLPRNHAPGSPGTTPQAPPKNHPPGPRELPLGRAGAKGWGPLE